MAIDLVAKLRLQDDLTRPLKKAMRSIDSASKSASKMAKATDSLGKTTSKAGNTVNKLGNAFKNAGGKASGLASSMSKVNSGANGLNSLKNTVLGIATAFLTAQGAAKALNATIGAAAKFEQQAIVTRTMFQDDGKAAQYMQMIEQMALDSAVLNSSDMMVGSKAFVGLTKDLDQLQQIWNVTERLQAYSGVDTGQASFSLKELLQGDYVSIVDAIGMDKRSMQQIAKLGTVEEKIAAISKELDKMGVTDNVLTEMAESTLGQWSAIQEKIQTVFRNIGSDANSKLGKVLKSINEYIDGSSIDDMAQRIGNALGTAVEKAVELGQWLWKWREPLLTAAKVVGVFAAALGGILAISGTIAGIGAAISFLTSPIGYIAVGVTAAVIAFKALYDNSERFRTAIDGIMTKVKSLYDTFKQDGVSGLLEALIPADILSALGARFATLKETFIDTFKAIYNAVVPILQTAWSLVSPILSALGNALKIVADVAMIAWNNILAPAISFVMKAFQLMWKIAGPIFQLLGAVIKAAFAVLRIAWDTIIGPFVAFLGGAFTHAFGMATEIVEALSPAFETLGGWIKYAAEWITKLADWISNIEVPDWIGKIGGGAVNFAKKLIPGNYHGLDSVPYDGYVTRLHKNEMVLNAREAKAYREGRSSGMSAPVINIAKMEVREDADIEKVAYRLAKYIEREASQIV